MSRRKIIWTAAIIGIIGIIGIAGYFFLRGFVRQKFDEALRGLPPSLRVSYTTLDPGLLTGSLVINDLRIVFAPAAGSSHQHAVDIHRLSIHGVHIFALIAHHDLQIGGIRAEGCHASLDQSLLDQQIPFPSLSFPFKEAAIGQFEITDYTAVAGNGSVVTSSVQGSLTVDHIHLSDSHRRLDTANLHIGDLRLLVNRLEYTLPGAMGRLRCHHISLHSAEGLLHIDTVRIIPSLDKIAAGRQKGHQIDYLRSSTEDITVTGLDLSALLQHRLRADRVDIKKNQLYIFRDRRLPRETDTKPLPVDYLRTLPFSIRVQTIAIGPSTVEYEEFPGKGSRTGTLKIVRLHGTLSPLINRPEPGDPAYMTLRMEGSLEGSGSVTAVTKMPLRKEDAYRIEGAFHDLDVTTLNASAENLGGIHLASGILNNLSFQFDMNAERSTGRIVGEYHNLVVQKLKGKNDEKKVDKVKSFFLRKFIIPRDKDRSLPESRRTGKVDYKHDPSRNFSYYMLHSLLVGVKSSFSLGFLLPG